MNSEKSYTKDTRDFILIYFLILKANTEKLAKKKLIMEKSKTREKRKKIIIYSLPFQR